MGMGIRPLGKRGGRITSGASTTELGLEIRRKCETRKDCSSSDCHLTQVIKIFVFLFSIYLWILV